MLTGSRVNGALANGTWGSRALHWLRHCRWKAPLQCPRHQPRSIRKRHDSSLIRHGDTLSATALLRLITCVWTRSRSMGLLGSDLSELSRWECVCNLTVRLPNTELGKHFASHNAGEATFSLRISSRVQRSTMSNSNQLRRALRNT